MKINSSAGAYAYVPSGTPAVFGLMRKTLYHQQPFRVKRKVAAFFLFVTIQHP
jgi:hypothetical protein